MKAETVRDQWCAEYVKVRDALKQLIDRLDQVHADPAYKSVWTQYHNHGGRYAGPTYTEALAKARKVVEGAEDEE